MRKALSVNECLEVMEESYREQAHSRAFNRPTFHSYLAHSLPNSTYSFKSVDGSVGKLVLELRVTSDIVRGPWADRLGRPSKISLSIHDRR